MGGFSDIGARHYFVQADFLMPELMLKELWVQGSLTTPPVSPV